MYGTFYYTKVCKMSMIKSYKTQWKYVLFYRFSYSKSSELNIILYKDHVGEEYVSNVLNFILFYYKDSFLMFGNVILYN